MEGRQLCFQLRLVCIQSSGWWSHHPTPYLPSALASGSPGKGRGLRGVSGERSQRPLFETPRLTELAAWGILLTTAIWHRGSGAGRGPDHGAWTHSLSWCCLMLPHPCLQVWPHGLMGTPRSGRAGFRPCLKPALTSCSPLCSEYWVMARQVG